MTYLIICKYCDYKWEKDFYSKSYAKNEKCLRCGDRNLVVKELSTTKINQYEDEVFKDLYKWDKGN